MLRKAMLVAETVLLLACGQAFSHASDPPATTLPKSLIHHPQMPQPTPMLELREIDRREEAENLTSIFIPPGGLTCGYLGGNQAKPHTCYDSEACAFVSYPSSAAWFNCCDDLLRCYEDVRTTCLGLEEAQSIGFCDSEASCNITQTEHPHSVFCTNISYPQCVTFTYTEFENGGSAYICGPEAVATDTFLTTPLGSEREFQTIYVNALGETVALSSSTEESDQADATDATDATASSSSTSTGEAVAQESEKSNDHVGAIVGGTLGGVALVAMAGLAAFFILRRRKRQDASEEKQSQQTMADTGSAQGDSFANTYQWQQQQQQQQQHPYEIGGPALVEANSHSSYYELQSASPATLHEVDNNEVKRDPVVEVR